MKHLLIFMMGFLSFNAMAQDKDRHVGKVQLEQLEKSEDWFLKNYKSYKPEKSKLKRFQKALPEDGFRFEVFFGTWCPDSQREVPRMVKIFEKTGIDKDQYDLIAVNRFKDLPEAYSDRADEIKLDRIPTLIYYKNGKAVNRFVEYAQIDLLSDMVKIVEEKGYKNSYHEE